MKQITITLVALVLVLGSMPLAGAVDCQSLIEQINAQRNFLLRKEMVEEAAKQCPDNPVLVFKYAFSLERFNKPEEALSYYKKAAELDPGMAQAYFGQGDIYNQLQRYEEAIVAYNKGLEIDPTNVRAIKCRIKAEEQIKAGK